MIKPIRLFLGCLTGLALTQCGSLPGSISDSPEISLRESDLTSESPAESTCDPDGILTSGAIYRICVPEGWAAGDSDLIIYVPGYTSPDRPIEIPEEQLAIPDGPSLIEIVNTLGIAFATTSFAANGLINGDDSIPDLKELLNVFQEIYGEPQFTYLGAVSLGTIAAAQFFEQSPPDYDGGLLGCGPLGDFQAQIDYLADARVVFDYFYPEVLPGDLLTIPPEVKQNWQTVYVPAIQAALLRDPDLAQEYFEVAAIPSRDQELSTVAEAVVDVLFFNVFGLEDAIERVGGVPYDNQETVYQGSSNDRQLNAEVDRFTGDPEARIVLQQEYQATGDFFVPLVTIHTIADPTVPYQQVRWFRDRVRSAGNSRLYRNIPSLSYGHCFFSLPSLVASLSILLRQVEGQFLSNPERVLTDPGDLAEYERWLRQYQ